MNKLIVSKHLIIGYLLILMLLIGLLAISINKVNNINIDMAKVTDINSVKQRYAINFRAVCTTAQLHFVTLI
jgi:methyl-accepting chemotaxis protein